MKKRFLDLSLSKKMLWMSGLIIIMPLFLAGIGISLYFSAFSMEKSYQSTWQVLDRALEEVESCWTKTAAIRDACIVNQPLQRLGNGEAKRKDYVDVKEFLTGFVEGDDIYENVCVVADGRILAQGGAFAEHMEEGLCQEVEAYFADNPQAYEGWFLSDAIQRSPFVKYAYEGDVLTYCGLVDNYFSQGFSGTIGILYVSVREEELCQVYGDFLSERTQDVFLMDSQGNILSAKDKEKVGTCAAQVQMFSDNLKKNGEGSFWQDGCLYIYKYSPVVDGYLVSVYSYVTYFSGIFLVCTVIGGAILICMLFVLAYVIMQKRYIVQPIYELVDKFGRMEQGERPLIAYDGRRDEIGILQQSYNKMIFRLEEMIEEIRQIGDQKKEAQLNALISQMNPHFLYNTLDSIHWKAVLNRDGDVAEQVLLLSDVYRYVLSKGKEFVTFREEFEFQEKYLCLMKMRFGDRLAYERELDKDLEEVYFPKLIIQPLLENAMIHGIEPKVEGGKISIRVCRDKEDVYVRVEDTGVGFAEDIDLENEAVETLPGSLAIKNVFTRLRLYYKEHVRFSIHSRKNQGCKLEIRAAEEAVLQIAPVSLGDGGVGDETRGK